MLLAGLSDSTAGITNSPSMWLVFCSSSEYEGIGRVEGEGHRGSVGGGGEGDLSRRSSLRRSNLAISISKIKKNTFNKTIN